MMRPGDEVEVYLYRGVVDMRKSIDGLSTIVEQELGLTSVVFSPCELMDPAELSAGADYLSVMRKNLADLAPAMGGGSKD